jgi:hypothetical protein
MQHGAYSDSLSEPGIIALDKTTGQESEEQEESDGEEDEDMEDDED